MRQKILIPLLLFFILPGCRSNLWDEYIKPSDGVARQNLLELLKSNTELSAFTSLVIQSGWDKELQATKIYTVWAPNNSAMTKVGSGITGDPQKLKDFIANHIIADNRQVTGSSIVKTIKMASGKNLVEDNSKQTIDGVKLLIPLDIQATNGVLHVVGAPLLPRKSVWEMIVENQTAKKHSDFLKKLGRTVFDPSVAIQTGVHPVTGRPVYDTLSGLVWKNAFIDHVADLLNEDSVYTAFLLSDQVFTMQYDRFKRYFNAGLNAVKTDSLTNWSICKDLVFPGYLTSDKLNGVLLSRFGVKVPVTSTAVVESYQGSNGLLYVINQCDIPVKDKILPIVIEGEDSTKTVTIATGGRRGYTRQKLLASGGFDFVLYNHLANPGIIRYYVHNINSVKYRFYWKAVNDFNYNFSATVSSDTVKQSLGEALILSTTPAGMTFGTPITISNGVVSVNDKDYATAGEVLVGTLDYVRFKDWIILEVDGSGKNTPITLDYIRMVPVFE
jgi:uncharacterized surface protein with fasciclin (FAS1) repeats